MSDGPSTDGDGLTEASLLSALMPLRARVEEGLAEASAAWDGPDPLPEAMRYAVLGGGKRLRPVLVIAACEVSGGECESALPVAVALELIHAYSLVHDDLPSMDDDSERRGAPTVHIKFGEAVAILAGDALLTEAFAHTANAPALSADQRIRCVATLAEAAGRLGMVGGQIRDIATVASDVESLRRMHAEKTGALFTAACRLGAICADATPEVEDALVRFGESLGEAFQISDDLLDLCEIGADDRHEADVNFAARLGIDVARQALSAACDEAESALESLQREVGTLSALARWVGWRAGAVTTE